MNQYRSFKLFLAVSCAFMICLGFTSQAAADLKEEVPLIGPETDPFLCDGDRVGRSIVESRGQDLARKLLSRIFQKDKDEGEVIVRIRFNGGPPDTTFNASWLTRVADCYDGTSQEFKLGTFTTDEDGDSRFTKRLPGGNPFEGQQGVLIVCIPDDTNPEICEDTPWTGYTSVLDVIFPVFD